MAIAVAAPGPRTSPGGPFPDLTSIDVDTLEEHFRRLQELREDAELLRIDDAPAARLALEIALRVVYRELVARAPRTPAARAIAPETELELAGAWGY